MLEILEISTNEQSYPISIAQLQVIKNLIS